MKILSPPSKQKLSVLGSSSYFSGLDTPALSELAQAMSLRQYERGEVIFWENEPCAGLYMLRSGTIKLFKVSPQGRELILQIFQAGATFNEVPVFDQGLNPVSVGALETCQVWLLERNAIRTALHDHPELCQAVIWNLTQNLRMLVGKVEELSFYQVTNRLARLLCEMEPEMLVGKGAPRITQDQMAAQLGTVREVVARALRELEQSGAIQVNRRHIRILDERLLRVWAQCDPE